MKSYCLVFYFLILVTASQKEPQDVIPNIDEKIDNILKRQIAEKIGLISPVETSSQKEPQDVVPNIDENIDILKRQIAEKVGLIPPIDSDQDEPVGFDGTIIKRTMEFVDKKKEVSPNLWTAEVTTATPVTEEFPVPRTKSYKKKNVARSKLRTRDNSSSQLAPGDTRRLLSDLNTPVEWIHCQDLITPFFSGYKTDISATKRLSHKDNEVKRLIQLIRMNLSGHTNEEIYSVLYQVNSLQIKLFQWDLTAINLLVTALVKDKPHNFRSIHNAVKALLASWHLDITNTTNILKKTRIFRPPCVKVSEYGGITMQSTGVRYPKPSTTPNTKCAPGRAGCN